MEVIDNALQPLVDATGFPVDQLKFVLSMVLAYPLAYVWRKLPSPAVKHVYSIVTGLALLVFCLGPIAWVHSFITSIITYLALRTLKPRHALPFVFVFAFGYLSVSHIYRTLTDYMGWTLDFTGSQMIVTLKLISVAFNLKDNDEQPIIPRPDNVKDAKEREKIEARAKLITSIVSERKRFALEAPPSLTEFLGFIYFPAALLAGPVFELVEYRNAAANLNWGSRDAAEDPSLRPSCVVPVLLAVGKALLMMGLVMLAGMYPMSTLNTPQYANEWPQWYRWYFLWASMALIRCKYYFGWFLAEGACNVSGLGYLGLNKQNKHMWTRCTNVSPLMVELPENARSVSTGWNCRVNIWLKRYVYNRVGKPGVITQLNTLSTFVVSAFWHGFYPGYYISFVSGAIFVETSRIMRRDLGPIFTGSGPLRVLAPLYNLSSIILSMWIFAYMCGPFQLLDARLGFELMRSLYFAPHLASIAAMALLTLLRPLLHRLAREPMKQE